MERVGVRDLRQRASEILRRVAAGESFEVTDRGRVVATLVPSMPSGLARLEREGRLRRGRGDLLEIEPLDPVPGVPPLSRLIEEGREE